MMGGLLALSGVVWRWFPRFGKLARGVARWLWAAFIAQSCVGIPCFTQS